VSVAACRPHPPISGQQVGDTANDARDPDSPDLSDDVFMTAQTGVALEPDIPARTALPRVRTLPAACRVRKRGKVAATRRRIGLDHYGRGVLDLTAMRTIIQPRPATNDTEEIAGEQRRRPTGP
jgi:hypothetical protein